MEEEKGCGPPTLEIVFQMLRMSSRCSLTVIIFPRIVSDILDNVEKRCNCSNVTLFKFLDFDLISFRFNFDLIFAVRDFAIRGESLHVELQLGPALLFSRLARHFVFAKRGKDDILFVLVAD